MQVAYIKKMEIIDSPRKIRRKERLIALLAMHGGATQVAIESGTPKSHISALVKGTRAVGDKLAAKFEALYGKPIGWFDMDNIHQVAETRAPYGNTETLPNLGKVPLIDWVAAGDFCGSSDPYPVGMAEDWLYCPARHGSKTYALRVRGESMYNPSGSPSFKDGDIIFIDPDKSPNHKSLVICRMDDAIETTFKRLLIEGSTKMLEALNPSWPERIIKVNGNATICGVVIGRFDTF
jgi:SOS-response transcriptional repressor LexA